VHWLDRRKFLKCIVLASAALVAWHLITSTLGREGLKMKPNVFTKDGKALVSKVKYNGDLNGSIRRTVDLIGGFNKVVGKGDRILLKPNFNTGDPPPASSDPEFVRTIIELLYEHGAGEVVLGESSTLRLNTRDVLKETGMLRIAEEAGARVVVFNEGKWVKVRTLGRHMKSMHLAEEVFRADKIVYALCTKTHSMATFTGSLKLAVGMMRPMDRLGMHLWRLEEQIADLNTAVHPDLMIMDARKCFISGGPAHGEAREPGLILASGDRIALDVEALRVMKGYEGNTLEKDVWDFRQIRSAVELGLGVTGENEYKVLME